MDEAQKATEAAAKAAAAADVAQQRADDSTLTKEQRAARDAAQKADDLRARAAEQTGENPASAEPATVGDAKVLAPVDVNTSAGDHFAQKFGNDPANPKMDPKLNPEGETVRLYRITPDHPEGPVYIDVHHAMVGDYQRAGWHVDATA